jgi:iron complex transport system substrate-binding protein
MRKFKNALIMSCLVLLVGLIVGCSNNNSDAEVAAPITDVNDVQQEETDQLSDNSADIVEDEVEEAQPRVITDMAGREVTIPGTIDKVFSVNNNGTILLYTLCPEKMVGWNSVLSDESKAYMPEDIANLPMLGILYGNSSQTNPEEILLSEPDIIIFMNATITDKIVEAADEIQEEMLIPVVVLNGGLDNYDETYLFAGDLLGVEEAASQLADYYTETYTKVVNTVSTIPEEEKVTVYYAREEDGLSTETAKSSNAELINLCGGINIAISDDASIKSPIVSIEQVMSWDPEVILTGNAGFVESGTYQEILTNENWSLITAVAEGNVYPTPQLPYNWFDRPPSVNRIIGMNYVLYTLYPEYYEGDIVEDVKEFYDLFYHYELTNEEAEALLNQ